MRWTEIFLMGGDVASLTDVIHEAKIIQSVKIDEKGKDPHPTLALIEVRGRIERIVEFLEEMGDQNTGGFSGLFPKMPEKRSVPLERALERASSWADRVERDVLPLQDGLNSIKNDRTALDEAREKISPFTGLDIDLQSITTLRLSSARIGFTRRYKELSEVIKRSNGSIQGSLINRKEGLHAVCIIYARSADETIGDQITGRIFSETAIDIGRLGQLLAKYGLSKDNLKRPIREIPGILDELERSIDQRGEAIIRTTGSLPKDHLEEGRAWLEAVEIEGDKEGFKTAASGTRYTSLITGWVEREREQELKRLLFRELGREFHLEQRDPTKEEIEENRVPTSLKNGWLGELFEPFTLTFSPPRYNEIDPSFWISIPFIVFFGLMLGDMGYGLLILAASLLIWVKGKQSDFLRRVGAMGILMGVATILAGMWMGGFFGDLIPRVILGRPSSPLYSLEISGYRLPYDTLRDPMILFQISLWLGLAQLNVGLILLGIDRLRKRKIWGFIKGTLSWTLLQSGAFILIGGTIVGWWSLSPALTYAGLGLFAAGALLLVFEGGMMFLFDIEGYMGDWISYTRILALGLSTFGLAMAFNIVGVMLNDISLLLVPLTFLLLVTLHIFNLALQTLGSAVHSLRLQYVEFFGRFYEGGGYMFEPFGRVRLHTKLANVGGIKEGGSS